MIIKVYLAGPEVFTKDPKETGKRLKEICKNKGILGLYPFDNECNPPTSEAIFKANFKMIQECDAVIANISPFRGISADPGTVWEVGAAYALNKPVFLYSDSQNPYKERVRHAYPNLLGTRYPLCEDYGLTDNLMIVEAGNNKTVYSSFESALDALYGEIKNDR